MTRQNISEAIGNISDRHVTELASFSGKKQLSAWLKAGLIAASLCIMIGISVFAAYLIQSRPMPEIPADTTLTDMPEYGSQDAVAPPYLTPLDYQDHGALISAVKEGFESDFYNDRIGENYPATIKTFDTFISELRQNGVPVPYLHGNVISLRNKEGFSNISLFFTEQFNWPWLWYFPAVESGKNYYIKITVLPDHISDELKKGSASELIRAISPGSPNTDNYKQNPNYELISECKLNLKDRTVSTLKYELKTDARDTLIFAYDDLLIYVCGDPSVWNEQWFSELSFERLK